jgi:hypothetical protein
MLGLANELAQTVYVGIAVSKPGIRVAPHLFVAPLMRRGGRLCWVFFPSL